MTRRWQTISARLGTRPAIWVAAGALMGLAGCLDLALVSSIAFPPTIRGLDPGQPWTPLPVGSWITEGGIEAGAISACFGCTPAAAVGMFRARGAEGEKLLGIAEDPPRLARFLRERSRAAPASRTRQPVEIAAAAEPVREGTWRGLAVQLARADGSRAAFGVALARKAERGDVTVIIVVAPQEDAARRIAREVAARA